MKKIIRRILKILGWTAAGLVFLVILLLVAIQLPAVQDFARAKIVVYLEKKLTTQVAIGHLRIDFPKKLVLENIFFGDQKKDTLLAGRRLAIDLDMFKLIQSKVKINSIELEGIYANIYRKGKDSFFNYDYIIKAFTSPSSTPNPADTNGVEIDISRIKLDKIRVNFLDDAAGNDFQASLGHFQTRIKKFDLNHMKFDVANVDLSDVVARVFLHVPLAPPTPVVDTGAGTAPIDLTLGPVKLDNIQLDYGNDAERMTTALNLGSLRMEPEKLDLIKTRYVLKSFELKNTTARVHQMKRTVNPKPAPPATGSYADTVNSYNIQVADLNIEDTYLRYDDDNSPRTKGMDYSHLKVDELNLKMNDLSVTPELYAGEVKEARMKEQSGFDLQELHTEFAYSPKGVQLQKLYVKTSNSMLQDALNVGWPSLEELSRHPEKMMLDVHLFRSYVGFRDVLIFMPSMAATPPFNNSKDGRVSINGSIKGYLGKFDIPSMEVAMFQNTRLRVRGRIIGLPDVEKSQYNLIIDELRTTNTELAKLVPPDIIPPDVQIPERLSLAGSFVGSMERFNTRLKLNSSRGTAMLIARMAPKYQYDAQLNVVDLDLKYILRNPDLGKVSATASANGVGIDPKTMAAKAKASVEYADYNGYTYRNLNLDASIAKGTADVKSVMRDPNLSFSLDATAMIKNTYPAVRMDLKLDSANLQKLGFYEQQLKLHGDVYADLSSTDPDALDGTIDLSHIIIQENGKRHAHPDTIRIVAVADSGSNRSLSVYSDVLGARLAGQYKLTEIGTALEHTISKYYHIPGFKDTTFTPQQWTLNLSARPTSLLYGFVPEMRGSDSIYAFVQYSSTTEDLQVDVEAPLILYSTTQIDSLKLRVSTKDSLSYALTMQKARGSGFSIYQTSLSGRAMNNTLTAALDMRDRGGQQQYALAATINQPEDETYKITFAPDLLLDREHWAVPADNYISYDPRGLIIHNFSISNNDQSFSIASQSDNPSAPIDVRFTKFRISTITRLAGQSDLATNGIIDGQAEIRNPMEDVQFTSEIKIQDLSYQRDTLGNLELKVNHEAADQYQTDIALMGHGNDVRLAGSYFTNNEAVNMDLEIRRFSLALLREFSQGQLQEAGGYMSGSLGVKGTLQSPSASGQIRFDSAFVRATLLGERFDIKHDAIDVDENGIHFHHFTLVDSSKNKAEIDGDVITDDFKNYKFALNIKADNFRAVNTQRGISHKPFYGRLNLSTNTKIRGDMNLPEVTSYIRINKYTDFSYVLPANDPEVQSREGVVQFVDFSEGIDSTVFKYVGDSAANAGIKGINLAATIETDSSAYFNIVLDERNGDAIHIRGTAALEADMDRSGKISLTGNYVMHEGSYLLTLNFLHRQFFVKPGSRITWDGDPTLADVDITAIYIANTAPIDLVQHQLAGKSQYEINQYKDKIPFQVLLNMKGNLLHPQVSFDIVMNDRDAARLKDVDSKLAQVRQDQSEINKQVFALLLIGHFVDENPLAGTSTPTTAESLARESASRILTDQLNRIAGNMVKGVDLTFGVNSGDDYSTGELNQRTDLSVGVSKRLMNDRLKVNVGSTFGIEGPTAPNENASNIAGNASIDYQLTKDGKYFVRAYYRNDYEGQVEGQVQETGATFIFRIDYDKFSEFFRKPKSKNPNTTVR